MCWHSSTSCSCSPSSPSGGASLAAQTALRVLFAVALPVGVAVLWGFVLAPRSPRRLIGLAGLAVKVIIFTVAAVLLGITQSWLWAALFWSVSIAVWAAIAVRERRGSPSSHVEGH